MLFELNGVDAPRFVAAVEVGALPEMVTFSVPAFCDNPNTQVG